MSVSLGYFKLYDSVEGTINNGATDTSVGFSNVSESFYTVITNDDLSNDFSVKFNSTGNNSVTVKAGETLRINGVQFTALYLSNSSGSNIAYRILLMGE